LKFWYGFVGGTAFIAGDDVIGAASFMSGDVAAVFRVLVDSGLCSDVGGENNCFLVSRVFSRFRFS